MNSEQNNRDASADGQASNVTDPQIKPAPKSQPPFSLSASHQSTNCKNIWLAWVLLSAGLIATALVALYVKRDIDTDAKRDFDFACDEINLRIGARINAHAQILRSVVALFDASEAVTREEWHAFTSQQKVEQHLPGIQGIGFSLWIPRERLAQHIQEIRSQGFPDYNVKPAGDRDYYTSIVYLEPFTNRNLRSFGYDMFSEPVRRMAMERARDQDTAALSGKVILVQETDKDVQAGTLMYVPVYQSGSPKETVAQRRDSILGWVYSPYRMNDLMQGILRGADLESGKRIRLQIFDNAQLSPESMLYDSQSKGAMATASAPRFILQTSTAFRDHLWHLRFTRTSGQLSYGLVFGVFSTGTIITLLLFGLVGSLLDTRFKAYQMANRLTMDLRESEGKFRLLIENSHDIIYTMTVDGVFTFVSPAWTALLGHPLTQVSGHPFQEFVHPYDHAECVAWLQKVIETGQRQDGIEYRVRHADGSWQWHTSSAVPLRDVADKVVGFEGTARDITARKRADEALRESEKRFHLALEGTDAGLWDWDMANDKVVYSERWKSMLGYEDQEVENSFLGWKNLWHTEDSARIEKTIEDYLAGKTKHYEIIHRCRHKNGDWRWILTRGAILNNSEGKPCRWVGTNLDITERKKVEGALRKSQERIHLLLNSTAEAIYGLDRNGNCTFCNNSCLQLLGYKHEEELLGKNMHWQIHSKHADGTVFPVEECRVFQAFNIGECSHVDNDVLWRSDGTFFPAEYWSYPQYNDGLVVGAVVTFFNITERKQAEAEKEILEAQNRQLQKSESLGRMAGAIAHHFNNQLQVVMMNLDFAMRGQSRGEVPTENLTGAMQSARKAAEVSTLMLTYLGQTNAKYEPLDLSKACLGSVPMLRATIPNGVILDTDFPSLSPVIHGNADQIQQVLTNLVTNAWEASLDGSGVIRIAVKVVSSSDIPLVNRFPIDFHTEENAYACLDVADEGCGIAEHDIETIFEPFFSTKFTGRGLGLPVVLGIVRAHQGVITVESKPGQGSVFRIFLPVSAEVIPQKQVPRKKVPVVQAHAPTTTCHSTVLVVDDEITLREVLATAIKGMGFTVLDAGDGVQAVEVFRQHQDEIRLVVCDLTMPKMDGWQTLEALRNLAPGIPVILSSGYSKTQVMAGNHPEQPQAFLSKPYEYEKLSEAVFRVLNRNSERITNG